MVFKILLISKESRCCNIISFIFLIHEVCERKPYDVSFKCNHLLQFVNLTYEFKQNKQKTNNYVMNNEKLARNI